MINVDFLKGFKILLHTLWIVYVIQPLLHIYNTATSKLCACKKVPGSSILQEAPERIFCTLFTHPRRGDLWRNLSFCATTNRGTIPHLSAEYILLYLQNGADNNPELRRWACQTTSISTFTSPLSHLHFA